MNKATLNNTTEITGNPFTTQVIYQYIQALFLLEQYVYIIPSIR